MTGPTLRRSIVSPGMVSAACDVLAGAGLDVPTGWLLSALEAAVIHAMNDGRAALPMLLRCPACGAQHIEPPDFPPHRTHQCQHCKDDQGRPFQWRPTFVPTEGVATMADYPQGESYLSDLVETNAAKRQAIGEAATAWLAENHRLDWFDARNVDALFEVLEAAGARL